MGQVSNFLDGDSVNQWRYLLACCLAHPMTLCPGVPLIKSLIYLFQHFHRCFLVKVHICTWKKYHLFPKSIVTIWNRPLRSVRWYLWYKVFPLMRVRALEHCYWLTCFNAFSHCISLESLHNIKTKRYLESRHTKSFLLIIAEIKYGKSSP